MQKILKNICWLIFDKVLILILQFFIGAKIANYYGSELYGTYNYILVIVSFSSIFFEIINDRVIKKYYNFENYGNIIYNVTYFRNTIAIFIFFSSMLLKFVIEINNTSYLILVLLSLDNVLVTSTTGIENYYEYKLESSKIVISNNIVKIVSYSLQYIGILLGYSIVMIPFVRCIGNFLRMYILKVSYKRKYFILGKNYIDIGLIKNIIQDSFYLWISFIAFIVYTQIDKIMLGELLGKKEVGIYSVGVQLSQILSIIIFPIQNSLFPKMIELYKKNYQRYIKFYFQSNVIITQIYLLGTIISIFIVKYLFSYIFSKEYIGAINVYGVLTIVILMRANGALQAGHMTLKDITKKSFYKTILGVIMNSTLNYFFILRYGMIGAALSTSITHIITLLIVDFFIPEYREQAYIQLKSFNPFYIINIIKKRRYFNSL